MIRFPFWLTRPDRAVLEVHDQPPDSTPLLAFSSTFKMAAYLATHKDHHWNVRLIDRYSFAEVLSRLQDQGYSEIYYDIQEDGNGGTMLSVPEILATLK
jgi:hypothetical protein